VKKGIVADADDSAVGAAAADLWSYLQVGGFSLDKCPLRTSSVGSVATDLQHL
jgi:hypothetical protein